MVKSDEQSVTLEEMLEAKENRAVRQLAIIHEYKKPIICLTMNIMGPNKNSKLIEKGYRAGKSLVIKRLDYYGLDYQLCYETFAKTGNECIISVDTDAWTLKKITHEVEETEMIGRVLDIDVLKVDGIKVSRTELGYQPRRCLICNECASVCSRSRSHELDTLITETNSLICSYLEGEYADNIAKKAVRSILYEVSAAPKAGLVDRYNNGAHHDMDFFTFLDSSSVLFPFFRKATLAGIRSSGDMRNLFESLRLLGKQAEIDMFEVTHGINTHKGSIFSLGIICGAAGFLWKTKEKYAIEELYEVCAAIAVISLKDFEHEKKNLSNGEKIFKKYGIRGARSEAASGFQSVKEISLPVLKECLNYGLSINDSSVCTLLTLLSRVYDTNIIKRTNIETQEEIHKKVKAFMKNNTNMDSYIPYMQKLDMEFQEKNISTGGCADILAITWMLFQCE